MSWLKGIAEWTEGETAVRGVQAGGETMKRMSPEEPTDLAIDLRWQGPKWLETCGVVTPTAEFVSAAENEVPGIYRRVYPEGVPPLASRKAPVCWDCDGLRKRLQKAETLIDRLVWEDAYFLDVNENWVPTGVLTCHFCGTVKGHPHNAGCRAEGWGHE